jgi:hypothetical protein
VSLLKDPVFDAFLTGASKFVELPAVVQDLAAGRLEALCHVIEYPAAGSAAAGPVTENQHTTETAR